jgi:hypothetical protein
MGMTSCVAGSVMIIGPLPHFILTARSRDEALSVNKVAFWAKQRGPALP